MTKNGNKATTEQAKGNRPAAGLAFVPRLMDLEAGAHYLSVGIWTLRELIWAGMIPVVKIPRPSGGGEVMRRVLVKREDLDAFVDGLEIDREVS
jgi:hypothetical protein